MTANRGLRKGKATRTKTGKREPIGSLGSDGDIRIVETSKGPKLKVKSKGKWWTAELKDESQVDAAGFIPKVWVDRGLTGSAGSSPIYINPPSYVTNNNIVGISFGVSLGAFERTYYWAGNDLASANYNIKVHYNKRYKYIRIELEISSSSTENKDYTLAVFYEDKKGA